jgi:hypothetical protein
LAQVAVVVPAVVDHHHLEPKGLIPFYLDQVLQRSPQLAAASAELTLMVVPTAELAAAVAEETMLVAAPQAQQDKATTVPAVVGLLFQDLAVAQVQQVKLIQLAVVLVYKVH